MAGATRVRQTKIGARPSMISRCPGRHRMYHGAVGESLRGEGVVPRPDFNRSQEVNRMATIFVSPFGSDAGPGTLAQPFRLVEQGVAAIGAPGDILYIRGGS